MPMARNTRTGETVKSQDLTGQRLQPHQRSEAQLLANRLADQMTQRSASADDDVAVANLLGRSEGVLGPSSPAIAVNLSSTSLFTADAGWVDGGMIWWLI